MSRSTRSTRVLAAAVGLVVVGLPLLAASPASAASAVPYSDPRAKGFIAFCDGSGHQVTSGRITDLPFVATAISSEAAPSGYAVKNGKATLYAFQPRQGVDPGDWSSEPLSGSSIYSNAAHPMASVTTADQALQQVLQAYPAHWDGLLQLRMFLSAPDTQPYTEAYPATDIRITGDTWTVVDGGTISCSVGKTISIETVLLPASTFPSPSRAAATAAGSSEPGAGSSAAPSSGTDVVAAGSDGSTPVSDSGSSAAPVGLLVAGVVALLVGFVLWFRARRI
jgi:hypothetical protein